MGFESRMSKPSGAPAEWPPQTSGTPTEEERRRDALERKEVNLILGGLKSEYLKRTGKDSLSQPELDALREQARKRAALTHQDRAQGTGGATAEEQEALISAQNALILKRSRDAASGGAVTESAIGIGDNLSDTAEAIRLANIDRENATLRPGEKADDVAREFMEKAGLVTPAREPKKPEAEESDWKAKLKRALGG